MSAGKHTPGPWAVHLEPVESRLHAQMELCKLVDGTAEFSNVLPMVVGANGLCTAVTGCGPDGEKNARRIVQCVNNFDALVEALRNLEAAFMSHTRWDSLPPAEIVAARAALSKATGLPQP